MKPILLKLDDEMYKQWKIFAAIDEKPLCEWIRSKCNAPSVLEHGSSCGILLGHVNEAQGHAEFNQSPLLR